MPDLVVSACIVFVAVYAGVPVFIVMYHVTCYNLARSGAMLGYVYNYDR